MAPERFGCDLLFAARGSWFGVQRKEFTDLLASMSDGRVGQQVAMMDGLERAMVIIEGINRVVWRDDGSLADSYARVTRDQVRGLLWSVRARGIWVDFTDDLTDTIDTVRAFERWCKKPAHKSLSTRPAARQTGGWGSADNRDWQLHLLQGLPGIGIELAERILDTLGMPLGFTVTREELLSVEGIGPKKVEKIMKCLPEKDWAEVVMSA